MPIEPDAQRKLVTLKDAVISRFAKEHWLELGSLTGCLDQVMGHDRLLRSLAWNDHDYAGHAFGMLIHMAEADERNLALIERYITEKFEDEGGESVSSAPSPSRKIYFTPAVFQTPEGAIDPTLVSVMMPFAGEFTPVFEAIKSAAEAQGLECRRVKDMWEHSTVIQDIFTLLFRSFIVVCDFTGKNPNVFYEAGIAHTLGKYVVPITQSTADVPFDLQHHRYLLYLNNAEGRGALTSELSARFATLRSQERS